jgi:hypothetical protein
MRPPFWASHGMRVGIFHSAVTALSERTDIAVTVATIASAAGTLLTDIDGVMPRVAATKSSWEMSGERFRPVTRANVRRQLQEGTTVLKAPKTERISQTVPPR